MSAAAVAAGDDSGEQIRFRDALLAAGVLVASGVDGLFGRGPEFVKVWEAVDAAVTRTGKFLNAPRYRFPPLIPRAVFEKTDYLRSFPNLIGSVHGFAGGDKEHRALLDALESGGDWSAELDATDVVLCPAACYPVYPMSTGQLPPGGRHFDVIGWCFRHEPSPDPARMQTFHQHEFVYLGDEDGAVEFRNGWITRGLELLNSFGLPVIDEEANDPFFGRAGRILAAGQRDEGLKRELVTPICSEARPTAIASCNCHRDHFGAPFGITTADGEVAHTACVGFGIERITLALFHHHGLASESWPDSVRAQLWP